VRVLFDTCVPRPLRKSLPGHDIKTAQEMGWDRLRNGDLIQMAEEAFDVLITSDQKLKYQQIPRAERSASSSCRQTICGRSWNSHPKSPVRCRKCLPAFFSRFSPEYFPAFLERRPIRAAVPHMDVIRCYRNGGFDEDRATYGRSLSSNAAVSIHLDVPAPKPVLENFL